jgi:acetyl esterase
MATSGPPKPELPLAQLFKHEPSVIRERMAKFWNKTKPYIPMTEVGSVTETSFKSIDQNDVNLRVYTPEGEGPFPAIVFFHGGGFVLCSLDTHDTLCRALCKVVGAVVISVDYRLAPEVNVHDDISI